MSSGRSFQAAAGIFKAAGRSGGYSAFNNVARSCFRVAAPTNLPQLACHARAQPTYGFAAQGVQTVTESCDAATSNGSSEGGSTPACCGTDTGCLSEGDSEGVIPHDSAARPAHLWSLTQPLPHYKLRRRDDKYHRPQRSTLCPTSLLRAAWQPPCLVPLPTFCSGARQPLAMMTAVPYDIRLYANHAVAHGSGADATDGDSGYTEAIHLQHPSRPRHVAPLPHVASATSMSTAEYRKHHSIYVENPERPGSFEGIPEPCQQFSDTPFPPSVMHVLRSHRFVSPSAIQAQAWPIAVEGRDLVAIASTGSGKTLGYLLPALMHIKNRGCDPALGPTAVVLAPTRELARQIEEEARRFSQVVMSDESSQQKSAEGRIGRQGHHGQVQNGLRSVCVYGGATRGGQLQELRRMPHLIIATPGRLLDFIQSGDVRMKQVSFLVLDEADRMLDMGFEAQIAEVSRSMSSDRQTLFFSATWPKDVRDAAATFAKRRAVRLFIGDVQSKPVAASTITQRVKVLDGAEKLDALEVYLQEQFQRDADEGGKGRRAIVFCQTKAGCDHLTHNINSMMSFQAASLHGDKTQAARDYALAKFRAGRVPVLVATDVAARGLDIPHVTCVVNFDMPSDIEMYIHRIGRTGRAGAKGQSLALVNRSRDGVVARSLLEVLKDSGQEVPQELVTLAQRSGGQGGYSGQRQYGRGSGHRMGSGSFGGRGGFVGSRHQQADGWGSDSGGSGRSSRY